MSNNTLNLDEDSLNILAESMKDSWSDIKDLYSRQLEVIQAIIWDVFNVYPVADIAIEW